MSRIRSLDTKIELVMRSALRKLGYQCRKNYAKLPGKPDIVFTKEKIAIFCDSDFWHGRNWKTLKKRLVTNSNYWIPKIERNRKRDRKTSKEITLMGWEVLRLWESDIKKNVDDCTNKICALVEEKRNGYVGKHGQRKLFSY